MYQFIETIKIQNRKLNNINFHNRRFNSTLKHFFNKNSNILLENYIDLSKISSNDTYKCRILYGKFGIVDISFELYKPKLIHNLKIVNSDLINYEFKYEDRDNLTNLYNKKENCDDVLIVKNGYITDTSYANVVFFKNGDWFTPDTYLLNGTKRQFLLREKKISEMPIHISDIYKYEFISIINAMLSPGEIKISTKNILF